MGINLMQINYYGKLYGLAESVSRSNYTKKNNVYN